MSRCSLLSKTLLLFSVLLCMSTAVLAQYNASVQGTVLDPSGAVLPNVSVSVTNQATGVVYKSKTSAEGYYRVSGLPPGQYTVSVEATGFKKQVLKDIAVAAEAPRGLDVTMQTGAANETVNVSADAAALQTENAAVSGN